MKKKEEIKAYSVLVFLVTAIVGNTSCLFNNYNYCLCIIDGILFN